MRAMDALDIDAATALFAPDAEVWTVYGRNGNGVDEVRALLAELLGDLRSRCHEMSSELNSGPNVWVAEFTATYEMKDFSKHGPYRRIVVLRMGPGGIEQMHMYGSHELPLPLVEPGYQEVRASHGWLPTL